MIWAYVFTSVFVVFAWKEWKDEYAMSQGFLAYAGNTFAFGFITTVVFLVGIGIGFIVGTAFPQQWTPESQARLVSLRNTDGVNGTLFLGTGSIGTSQHYFYYREVEGGYEPGTVVLATNNIIVHEEHRQDAWMRVYVRQFTNPTYILFGLVWPHERYAFFIPRGTLQKNFVLQ